MGLWHPHAVFWDRHGVAAEVGISLLAIGEWLFRAHATPHPIGVPVGDSMECGDRHFVPYFAWGTGELNVSGIVHPRVPARIVHQVLRAVSVEQEQELLGIAGVEIGILCDDLAV